MNILRTAGSHAITEDERLIAYKARCIKSKLFYEINLLHDHEGILSIFWNTEPNEMQKRFTEMLWEEFNEPREYVEHYLISRIQ
jgi:hypothetical protein